jgi:hypothetical protein
MLSKEEILQLNTDDLLSKMCCVLRGLNKTNEETRHYQVLYNSSAELANDYETQYNDMLSELAFREDLHNSGNSVRKRAAVPRLFPNCNR